MGMIYTERRQERDSDFPNMYDRISINALLIEMSGCDVLSQRITRYVVLYLSLFLNARREREGHEAKLEIQAKLYS